MFCVCYVVGDTYDEDAEAILDTTTSELIVNLTSGYQIVPDTYEGKIKIRTNNFS